MLSGPHYSRGHEDVATLEAAVHRNVTVARRTVAGRSGDKDDDAGMSMRALPDVPAAPGPEKWEVNRWHSCTLRGSRISLFLAGRW
ncbi:hypothetical protein Shyhy01_21110 [Streptomyces hygroscopicus subsp. hygroscopicus]|nr:hypothetical protein Shyhy01_21110 [Streptomyces hygroscopicus subsp. hygroscopicus]